MASKTLKGVEWENTALITDRVVHELTERKQRLGKNISIAGSATLVRSLLSEGLVDELRLLFFPIVLGSGKPLFDDWAGRMRMRVGGVAGSLRSGVLSLVYEPGG